MSDTDMKSNGNEGSLIHHFVAFRFKSGSRPVDIQNIEKAFSALKDRIDLVHSLRWGTNNSPEGLNKNCSHGFLLTFTSTADRDEYLVHPDHLEFVDLVSPHVEDVFVLDFTG